MIQRDPDTKTNVSMFFSLSQRFRCRRGSDCSIDCRKSPTIWQIKEGGATIYPKQTTVGVLGPGIVVASRFCCAQTGATNPRRPIKASFLPPPPPVRIPPSPSSTAAQWQTVLFGFKDLEVILDVTNLTHEA